MLQELLQLILQFNYSGGNKFYCMDVLIAGATAIATIGKGVISSVGLNMTGASLGSLAKGEAPDSSVVAACFSTIFDSAIEKNAPDGISETVVSSYISEVVVSNLKSNLDL